MLTLMTRREFLRTTATAAALSGTARLAAAKYDLLVKGGRVVDPSQRVDRLLDVAIRGGRIAELGTLRTGAAADVAVLDMKEGDFEFVDNYKTKRIGHGKLVALAVVRNGRRVWT